MRWALVRLTMPGSPTLPAYRAPTTPDRPLRADADADADTVVPIARCEGLPPTWGLVALVGGADPCPAGYEAGSTDLRAGATPRADACTCGCTLATQPTCARGAAGATYDSDNSDSCGLASSYGWATLANGACGTDMWPGPWTTSHDWSFAAPVRSGGSCTAAAQKHADRVDFARSARGCVPTAGCEGAPALTAPSRRCVISDGDVTCPAGRFQDRSVMAKSFDVACAGACTCGITGTCGSGTVTFYAGANCTGSSFALAANGTCASSPGTGSIVSYKYTATLGGAGCTAAGAPAASTVAVGATTICCE